MQYSANVIYDEETGDYVLPLDDEALKLLGWKPGDVLLWHDNKDGTYSVTKKED